MRPLGAGANGALPGSSQGAAGGRRRAVPESGDPAARLAESAIPWLRWGGVVAMLLIVLAWPQPGRAGHLLWPFVGGVAAYNVVVTLARRALPGPRSWRWIPLADLPVAAAVFYFDYGPGGPLFLTFYLGLATAALSWSPPAVAAYAAATVGAIALIAPTLPDWTGGPGELRELASRLIVMVTFGVGGALLRQRLAREAAAARASREAGARLDALQEARAGLVASVSHELRTPLTAVQAGLDMLEASAGDRLRPDERDLLASTRRGAMRLGFLIDDLLTHNLLDAGALRLDRRPLDLREVVADAVAAVHPLIRRKDQRVEVDLPAPLPVVGDPRRLGQVVTNLLANAHAHTSAGTCFSISGRVADGRVVLTVADDGSGIPAAELERIFERFFRRRTATGPGSGLGLAISRAIAELHGGRLWAESEEGRGAIFRLELPAA